MLWLPCPPLPQPSFPVLAPNRSWGLEWRQRRDLWGQRPSMIWKVSAVHMLSLKGSVYGDRRPLVPALGCLKLNVLRAADGLFQTKHLSSLPRVPHRQEEVGCWCYWVTGFIPILVLPLEGGGRILCTEQIPPEVKA